MTDWRELFSSPSSSHQSPKARRQPLAAEKLEERCVPSAALPFDLGLPDALLSDPIFAARQSASGTQNAHALSSAPSAASAPVAVAALPITGSAAPSSEGSALPPHLPARSSLGKASALNPLLASVGVSADSSKPNIGSAATFLGSAASLGTNLGPVVDYMAEWIFTDAFKQSRPWISLHLDGTPDTTDPVNVDSRGWPTSLAANQQLLTLMYDNILGHYPTGTYRAEWQGTGTVTWGGDAVVTQTGTTGTGTHFALLSVTTPSNAGITMALTATTPGDPVRNIHVWMPDYNGQSFAGQVWQPGANFSPFHPLYLQRLAPFHTLRFMNMQSIPESQIVTWANSRPYDYETQNDQLAGTLQNGVAPEYMVELCNELNADMWINLPHMADSTYVSNLATYVHDHLKPNLHVYVEWSNEAFYPGWAAYPWIVSQDGGFGIGTPQFVQFVAQHEQADFALWSSAFSLQPGRLVRVVAGISATPPTMRLCSRP